MRRGLLANESCKKSSRQVRRRSPSAKSVRPAAGPGSESGRLRASLRPGRPARIFFRWDILGHFGTPLSEPTANAPPLPLRMRDARKTEGSNRAFIENRLHAGQVVGLSQRRLLTERAGHRTRRLALDPGPAAGYPRGLPRGAP